MESVNEPISGLVLDPLQLVVCSVGVVGVSVLLYGCWLLWRAADTYDWLPVSGKVLSAPYGGLTYEYEWLGVRHTGSRIAIGGPVVVSVSVPFFTIPLKGDSYREGIPIRVYVNPKLPTDAVLRPGIGGAPILALCVGSGFVYCALSLWPH